MGWNSLRRIDGREHKWQFQVELVFRSVWRVPSTGQNWLVWIILHFFPYQEPQTFRIPWNSSSLEKEIEWCCPLKNFFSEQGWVVKDLWRTKNGEHQQFHCKNQVCMYKAHRYRVKAFQGTLWLIVSFYIAFLTMDTRVQVTIMSLHVALMF